MKLPAKLNESQIVIVRDQREQKPFAFPGLTVEVGHLPTADYSLRGMEDHVALERKSLPDFLGVVGHGRARFESELKRLQSYAVRAVICEFSWASVQMSGWRNKVTPQAVEGSILSWTTRFQVPILLFGDRQSAEDATRRILIGTAQRRYRELRSLLAGASENRPLETTAMTTEGAEV